MVILMVVLGSVWLLSKAFVWCERSFRFCRVSGMDCFRCCFVSLVLMNAERNGVERSGI